MGILLIEDDADVRDAVRTLLEDEGYEVTCLADSGAALSHLAGGGSAELVLLDLMTPVVNGWAFLAERRKEPRVAAIPVVVLSGDARARERALEQGADEYLAKPCGLDELLARVGQFVRPAAPALPARTAAR